MAIEKRYVNYKYEFSPYVREPKTVLDSGFYATDSRYLTLDSGRFFVSGTGIPDSSHQCHSGFLELCSGVHDPKLRILHSTNKNFPDSLT